MHSKKVSHNIINNARSRTLAARPWLRRCRRPLRNAALPHHLRHALDSAVKEKYTALSALTAHRQRVSTPDGRAAGGGGCRLLGLKEVKADATNRALLWGHQFLNPYAFDNLEGDAAYLAEQMRRDGN